MKKIQTCVVVKGSASACALVSDTALSFWGGVDPHSGRVIDVHHDLSGQSMSGKALCIPAGRGSCSGSGIMLEMIRQKTHPAMLISMEAEPIISLGSVMGYELYGRGVPICTVSEEEYAALRNGMKLTLSEDGMLTIEEQE